MSRSSGCSCWTVVLKARPRPAHTPSYLQDSTSGVADGLTYTLLLPRKLTFPPPPSPPPHSHPCPPPPTPILLWAFSNLSDELLIPLAQIWPTVCSTHIKLCRHPNSYTHIRSETPSPPPPLLLVPPPQPCPPSTCIMCSSHVTVDTCGLLYSRQQSSHHV